MDANDIVRAFQSQLAKSPPVVLYSQLEKLTECIFLYEGVHTGHWCAIIKHPYSWEIFDPVGVRPDDPIDNPRIVRVPKKLQKFCIGQNMLVEYNAVPLQKGGKSCGLWCVWRFMHKDLSCDEFAEEFEDFSDKDLCLYFNKPDLI